MKKYLWLLLVAGVASADELGIREVWNAATLPAAQWETAAGITVTTKDGAVQIQCGDAEYGWAAARGLLPVTTTTFVNLETAGNLKTQIEWIRANGEFITATEVGPGQLAGKKLLDLLPAGERPRKFRFKFWVEGRQAAGTLTKASVTFERAWRKPGTKLLKAFSGRSPFTPGDGLVVQAEGDAVRATVESAEGYAAFQFDDRLPFDKPAVLLADIAALENGVLTVQAVCWDGDGNYLDSVDLIKHLAVAGATEIAFPELPAGTAEISLKVWLSGPKASARLAGLFYGRAP